LAIVRSERLRFTAQNLRYGSLLERLSS
jgi:hypothetical protein